MFIAQQWCHSRERDGEGERSPYKALANDAWRFRPKSALQWQVEPEILLFFGGHLAIKGLQVDTLCLPWSATTTTTTISTWYKLKLIESGVSHKLQFGYGSVGVRVRLRRSWISNFNSKENLWQVAKMSSSAPLSDSLYLPYIVWSRVCVFRIVICNKFQLQFPTAFAACGWIRVEAACIANVTFVFHFSLLIYSLLFSICYSCFFSLCFSFLFFVYFAFVDWGFFRAALCCLIISLFFLCFLLGGSANKFWLLAQVTSLGQATIEFESLCLFFLCKIPIRIRILEVELVKLQPEKWEQQQRQQRQLRQIFIDSHLRLL